MRRALIVLVVASSIAAGCASRTAQTEQGYYASGGDEANRKAQKQIEDKERAQAESARDFAQPRGLWW